MNSTTTALFLGRFQPFHNGHLDAVAQIFATGKVETLLIAIGSSQISHEPSNPFTAGERWQMIYHSLLDAGYSEAQFKIMPLADISHNHLWPHFVQQQLPPFTQVFSGSPWVRELFNHALPKITTQTLQQQHAVSATAVRAALAADESWQQLVPVGSATVLKKLHAGERIANISQTGF